MQRRPLIPPHRTCRLQLVVSSSRVSLVPAAEQVRRGAPRPRRPGLGAGSALHPAAWRASKGGLCRDAA